MKKSPVIRFFFNVSVLILALAVMALVALKSYVGVFAKSSHEVHAMVEIPRGSSLKNVCELLYEQGIIENKQLFYWYIRLGRKEGNKVQAGFYQFDGFITNEAIVNSLKSGRDRAYKITFKEGETLINLVQNLTESGLITEEEFIAAMKDSPILSFIPEPLVTKRQNLKNDMGGVEGYLFPDTYFFTKKDGAHHIISTMHNRLMEKLDGPIMERIKERGQSLHEVLTLAAIVEKETGAAFERPIIASVYQNRLMKRMRLQADPTVIYGIKDYDGKIHKSDLLNYHPYNTYTISALPPGPIAAPGLLSIRAVLWPSETNYLYFVSKNDGTHIFCENLNCHNQAVKKWQIDFFKSAARSP